MIIYCSECGKLMEMDTQEGKMTLEPEPMRCYSFRTSGAARILCENCKKDVTRRMKKQGTPYLVTPYISVHAMNALKGAKK